MKKLMIVAALAAVWTAQAKVAFAPVFGDKMVLQRDMPVRVWGTAAPGEAVKVSFAGQSRETKACAKGKWMVELGAMSACKEGRTLAANDEVLKDVLVGEVWFCSGQSNTDCPIWGGGPRYRDGQGAMHIAMTVKPWVRLVKTPLVMDTQPKLDVKAEWTPMTPQAMEQMARKPSAMGYYYALELANALDIPIGLVDSSWGGTNIDAWTPRSGYEGLKDLDEERNWKVVSQKDWKAEMRKGPIGGAIQQPSALWYGMVAAYTPMSIRGFIWYQGCHNAGEYQRYANKMHALYNGWAKEFKNPDLKLYFVQLAPWGNPGIAYIQEAQAQFDREEKNAGMAVINDVGNLADIHPNDKRRQAHRREAPRAPRPQARLRLFLAQRQLPHAQELEGRRRQIRPDLQRREGLVHLQPRPQRADRLRGVRRRRQVGEGDNREPRLGQGTRRQAEVRRKHQGHRPHREGGRRGRAEEAALHVLGALVRLPLQRDEPAARRVPHRRLTPRGLHHDNGETVALKRRGLFVEGSRRVEAGVVSAAREGVLGRRREMVGEQFHAQES